MEITLANYKEEAMNSYVKKAMKFEKHLFKNYKHYLMFLSIMKLQNLFIIIIYKSNITKNAINN